MVCRRRPGPRRRELQRGRRQGGGKGVGCDCERLRTRLPTNDAAALYRFLLLLRLPLSTTTVGVDEVFNVLASPPIDHRAFLRLFSLFFVVFRSNHLLARARETERLYICYRLQFHKSSDKTQITSNRERNPPEFYTLLHALMRSSSVGPCTPLEHTMQQWGPTAVRPNFRSSGYHHKEFK